ncbi:MAG: porin family protein [Rhodothermales bacterium]
MLSHSNGSLKASALLVFSLFLFSSPASAQVRLGILGGGNFAALNDISAGDALVNFDNTTGYHIGAFVDIGFGALGVRPAVYYLDAGPLFQGAGFLEKDDFNMVYVSVPVDLRFSLGAGPVKPYFLAGPEVRILTSAQDAPPELEDQLSNLVVNAGLGLGLEVNVPGFGITLYPQIRYSFGLSDLVDRTYEINDVTISTDGGQRPNMWLLSLGIGF